MSTIRAAVVQAAPVGFDRERSIDRVRTLAVEAAASGAGLIVFPEAFVPAYPRGLDFGARVGWRTPAGRDWFQRYWDQAVAVPGPAASAIGEAAREASALLVVGVIERDGGTLYCSVLFFGPDGALLGKHRKLMPTAAERLVWGFGDGSTMPVLDTPAGRLGAAICWENYMPLLRMHLYAQGVQIYCAPTADHRDGWTATMRHVALEGRCFVLSCNQFTRRSDYPDDYPIEGDLKPDDVLSRGGSCIVDPLGRLLAGPDFEGPCILAADLDLGLIPRAKYDFDVVGHYARPDVFRLLVDTRPKPVVEVAELGAFREPGAAGGQSGDDLRARPLPGEANDRGSD
ncbi:carbon-nitrogen hydrolase family protein [Tautonia sociabilis]|uniref:Carbon-nitrogen hydrolase family protein n=1 Tax=Tautonia sociabilis TaxID=2080755 RepID=A0A432MP23_9BACT|nr:carbon-nitrogen hydrolase family protein [Tautonia sociabilis]RUL89203.1 carbon-nitrogen hydrolase family protein [Tautonia sociabilis]